MQKFYNNFKQFFKRNFKKIVFILIFVLVCYLYNVNSQTLNFILKRGVVLEYSVSKDADIDKEKIENKLLEKNIKYSFIESYVPERQNYDIYDKKIEKVLYIALPLMAKSDKTDIYNDISDFVFDNYQNSKLLNIKTLNDNYHKSYGTLKKFFKILCTSFVLFIFCCYFIIRDKMVLKDIKTTFFTFFKTQKNNIVDLAKKTKEKGFKYFLKKVLFDEKKSDNENEKEPNECCDENDLDIFKEIINTIIFVLISVIIIRYFIGELRWIPSGSMRPTILEHDRVFVEKLSTFKKEIKRGDILVFYPPEVQLSNSPWAIFTRLSGIFCKDIAYIKRVIGMPGDKFEVKYNNDTGLYHIYINDEPLNEPYIISNTNWNKCSENMYCGPFVIPDNHYFMMGDNRENSQDSRYWGFLDKNRVIGKANFMFFPFRRINVLSDKYFMLHQGKEGNKYKESNYILNRYEFLYKI